LPDDGSDALSWVISIFEVATANDLPGDGHDLACLFDALHDLGDLVHGAGSAASVGPPRPRST
jgi:hypothetical protein